MIAFYNDSLRFDLITNKKSKILILLKFNLAENRCSQNDLLRLIKKLIFVKLPLISSIQRSN